jgi:hypothetical protein
MAIGKAKAVLNGGSAPGERSANPSRLSNRGIATAHPSPHILAKADAARPQRVGSKIEETSAERR